MSCHPRIIYKQFLGKKEDHPGAQESKHGAVVTTLAYNSSVPSSSKIRFHMTFIFVDSLLRSKKLFFPLGLSYAPLLSCKAIPRTYALPQVISLGMKI